jgi:GDP-4-dehydro-6-deoxy-D-mannose reductase
VSAPIDSPSPLEPSSPEIGPRGPILVTGAAGFAGSHLLDLIKPEGQPITGWHLHGLHPLEGSSTSLSSFEGVEWRAVDLTDRESVRAAIADGRPAEIYHLAGAANQGNSWERTDESLRANALGTHHLLDALRRERVDARVLVIGSAAVYRPKEEPFDEESAIGPTSPYGMSKLAQEMTALQSFTLHDQRVIVSRSFNHIGPRQNADYVASSFARQIAMIEAGQAPPVIMVGNLEARRDLMDVRDTVRAYRALMRRGEPGRAYNVCSGEAHAIRELLDGLLAHSTVNVDVCVDVSRLRPVDQPLLVGRLDRIRRETGWQPEIGWSRTLADLLQDWRARLTA